MSCVAHHFQLATFLLLVAASVIPQLVRSHPQCLDSHPPFKPDGKIALCKDSSRLGCCTKQQGNELKILYERALRKVRNKQCGSYLSTVVCLKCHSWSAHIFNAEANPHFKPTTALPCLGLKYCARFVSNCKKAVEHIWGDTMKARNITLDNFCEKTKTITLKDHCYPRIKRTIKRLNNPKLSNTVNGSFAQQRGCLCVREVAKNLRSPLALVHANDRTYRMFVVEQIGIVYVILPNGTKIEKPFLNITDKVLTSPYSGDERGLLGIAFHPNYRSNGRVFIYYITRENITVNRKSSGRAWWLQSPGFAMLSEFRVSRNDPNQLDPNSEKTILTIPQPAPNHNGGQLLFGDDKMLYVFPGDGGSAGDPFGQYGNGLNKSSLLGKVLRIDINKKRGKPYRIPADNPFLHEPRTHPEIYAYGIRNMWRCSKDRGERSTGYGKGRIFCGDVGQNEYEEIDVIVKGGNYGWRGREGYKCYDKRICNSSLLANEILPIHAYSHSVGQSVVGGYVYRGCSYPKMRGLYFFADTMNGRIFTLKENKTTGQWQNKEVYMGDSTYCNGPGVSGNYAKNIYSFGEDEAGELYMVSTQLQRNDENLGAVYQLIDPERRTDPSQCKVSVRKPARLGCKDRLRSACPYYARRGYCVGRYENYMKHYCKLSCNKC